MKSVHINAMNVLDHWIIVPLVRELIEKQTFLVVIVKMDFMMME